MPAHPLDQARLRSGCGEAPEEGPRALRPSAEVPEGRVRGRPRRPRPGAGLTTAGRSHRGHPEGTAGRVWESLEPIVPLFEDVNADLWKALFDGREKCPYTALSKLSPPVIGGPKSFYRKKNIILPLVQSGILPIGGDTAACGPHPVELMH